MKNNTRKCPNCGAKVPADAKYCPRCDATLDSGRVGTLPKNNRPVRNGDALRDLPKPVRPTEELEHPSGEDRGFFSPEREKGGNRPSRPVEAVRGGYDDYDREERSSRRMWQIAAVLAIILVIIVVAIVLVIKLNQRPSGQGMAPSPEFTTAPTDIPTPSPEATPFTVVTPTPMTMATPEANAIVTTPTPVPSPSPTPSASPLPYNIQPANETVYLTGSGVNIRKGPGTDYDVIGTASTGQYYTRTGRVDNGWSRISYNGGDAYISDSFLSTAQPTATPAANYNVTATGGTVTVTAEVNLRKGPGTNYDSIGTVPTGTQLTRTGYTDSWTRVQYNGQEVFVYSTYVSDGSTSNNSSSGGTTSSSGTGTVTGNMVNVRSGPGTGYSAIGSYNSGATVTITGESSGWYQISYNGQTGYISSQYVTKN